MHNSERCPPASILLNVRRTSPPLLQAASCKHTSGAGRWRAACMAVRRFKKASIVSHRLSHTGGRCVHMADCPADNEARIFGFDNRWAAASWKASSPVLVRGSRSRGNGKEAPCRTANRGIARLAPRLCAARDSGLISGLCSALDFETIRRGVATLVPYTFDYQRQIWMQARIESHGGSSFLPKSGSSPMHGEPATGIDHKRTSQHVCQNAGIR